VSRLILIVGGCRSGKSDYARKLASSYRRVAYIATADAGDAEMQARIARHQRERPKHWLTVEEPLQIASAIQGVAGKVEAVVLDCLTLYLSNLLTALGFEPGDTASYPRCETQISRRLDEFVQVAKETGPVVIVVTNELGTGIVPLDRSSRFFRDMAGLMNQRLARAADEVYKLEVGIPVRLK
jgi:adenosylcobinamide kinase/adenosylcobinamide-phosphate guanylyltransferase